MILLGEEVRRRTPMGGGDLSKVTRVELASGRVVVLKEAPGAGREARMLQAIAEAGIPCPEILEETRDRIVMTLLPEDGRRSDAALRDAGAAVARLHSVAGEGYGWTEDHAFGVAAIPNASAETWVEFWAMRRLLAWPEVLPPDVASRLERLAGSLTDRLPPAPRPVLLHGDLWSGNLLFSGGAFSGLIDPACYHGHGEVDLAMLDLFGGLDPTFLKGYGALEPGWQDRRPIYQLWPALVHLRLFGSGYRAMVERLLEVTGV